MKILNVIWKFSTGGIGKCFQTYARLHDVDKDVEVVSVCIDPQDCAYDRTALKAMEARIIPIKSVFDFSWQAKTKGLIDEVQPDLIFCHGFNGPVVVQRLRQKYHFDIPMVCSYHGLYHAPSLLKRPLSPLFNNLQMLCYRKYAQKVIPVENYSLTYLKRKHVPQSKITVVHNGIAPHYEAKKIDLPKKGISIGLASRLDKVKGIEYLLEAVPLIKAKAKERFHIYVVGNGPLDHELRKQIAELHIEDDVTMTGYQGNIPDWLATWDIFCLPSLHEYHSIALLEAMRAGKAIVATNVGGNTESVRDGQEGLIVPSRDSSALADALIKLIESSSLRSELGKYARERFEREFTEEVMKRNLVKVMKEVYDSCKK